MATAKSNQQEKDQSADVLKWILGQTYRAKAEEKFTGPQTQDDKFRKRVPHWRQRI